VSALASTIGIARSNLMGQMKSASPRRRGRSAASDDGLLGRIKAVIARMPTYGYRRVHANLPYCRRGGKSACPESQTGLARHA
jgi:putative transposase